MTSYDDFEPNRLKHLELIQAVVSRLAGNSFLVKGWAITVAAALIGFAVGSHKPWLAVVGFIPTVAFWGIDAYFLKSERLFRALYDHVRTGDEKVAPFFMGATSPDFVARVRLAETAYGTDSASWIKTARRPVLSIFYIGLLAANGFAVLFADMASGSDHPHSPGHLLGAVAGFADSLGNAL